ncbi:ABC transporter permease subunit [Pseudoroseomonas wenyumeiae]|uniref:ABC transporter permease n=1 Tax=Teichococcus wenyumeiae TaxID=2478470 RepID=A0A3A9JAW6_9PROT|nr:ABC transporter permease [Pseudoroseomonas wenyumeiae]RKK01715.1 ABC transporter permease [Pseudoroseomonas wenyumeiae]RMI26834.1 ABC transporter permease subunit [Pseudoroseomonas wenyumeiae]
MRLSRRAAGVLAQALAFLLALWAAPHLGWLWGGLFPEVQRPVWDQRNWFALLGSHLLLSLGAAAVAAVLGLAGGILATRQSGRRLRPLLDALFSLAQAVPPIAVIALALPALGFGAAPTLLALVLYACLPVLRGAVAGLDGVPPGVLDAARGIGMGPWRGLTQIEMPLALPVVLSSLRLAVVLSIATAAVGAMAGAECLGTPIVVGLANNNGAYVLQGGLFTAWLALLADRALALLLPARR